MVWCAGCPPDCKAYEADNNGGDQRDREDAGRIACPGGPRARRPIYFPGKDCPAPNKKDDDSDAEIERQIDEDHRPLFCLRTALSWDDVLSCLIGGLETEKAIRAAVHSLSSRGQIVLAQRSSDGVLMVVKELDQNFSRCRRIVSERRRGRQVNVNFVPDSSVIAAASKLDEAASTKASSVSRLGIAELFTNLRSRVVIIKRVCRSIQLTLKLRNGNESLCFRSNCRKRYADHFFVREPEPLQAV